MNVALYDFDGTIYNGDSSVEYALFCIRRHLTRVPLFIIFCFVFVLYKFSFVSKQDAKSWLFKMMDDDAHTLQEFWSSRKDKFIASVIQMLKEDSNKGTQILVISASPRFLVASAMELVHQQVHVIATETKPDYPQRLLSLNCFGSEKVQRFKIWKENQTIPTSEIEVVKVVSDSLSDLPIYHLGGRPYHVHSGLLIEGLPKK